MTSNSRLPLYEMTAHEAIVEIAAQRVTAKQLVCALLDRITERDSSVQAWSFIDGAAALKQAERIDKGPWRGVLHGIPVGIKDIVDTYDMPTECGSTIYQGRMPHCDASCVAMARAAGAIILGKTVTTEFATRHPGKTTNPHDSRFTPGGSSSGSAAAVADHMVPLAVGTQTGGSVVRPASYCGVVGYKPSFGLINRAGVKAVAETLDTIGVFARDVQDVGLFAAALSGCSELATFPKTLAPRIGICRTFDWPQATVETHEALNGVAHSLATASACVTEIELPPHFRELGNAHRQIQYFELSRALRDEYERHPEKLSDVLKSWISEGLACPRDSYQRQLRFVADCRRTINLLFDEVDVLLTPSALGEATFGLQSTGNAIFNSNWTALGLPCLNIPACRGPNNLPVGVQVVGRYHNDEKTLGFADWIYRALKVHV